MNLDKDIGILKELAEDTIRYKMVETDAYMAGAITRVLSELERYKQYYEEQNEVNKKFVSKDKFDEVNSELETYKKIAEKLAIELYITKKRDEICKNADHSKCVQRKVSCIDCIIDVARKEVEKDVKD
jgi:hypothetical protein